MKVLHVVESYGGGVVTALDSYLESAPDIEHILLYSPRANSISGEAVNARFAEAFVMRNSAINAISDIRRVIKSQRPDVIHAHSSFAGAYVRLSIRSTRELPIIYTPHGFSFERTDIGVLKRKFFWLLELILSLNTHVIAGCSPRETLLADRFPYTDAVYLPNVVRRSEKPNFSLRREENIVLTVGRIAEARDPEYYLATINLLQKTNPGLQFIWVGDGDKSLRIKLQKVVPRRVVYEPGPACL